MQIVKHNNDMASFIVKIKETSPCTKILIIQTMHNRSLAGKCRWWENMELLNVHNG